MRNSIGQNLVLIPAGKFMMGSPASEAGRCDDERLQEVTISKTFYMSETPITQGQWKAVMQTTPWSGGFSKDNDQNAASYISWNDAAEFCRLLSQREGKTYRLPTEAEWEYACRAGTTTAYNFGDDQSKLGDYAWFWGNREGAYPHPVVVKQPNAFGLYDMHGNVWEWCADYHSDYLSTPTVDPQDPISESFCVLRGGSWNDAPMNLRSSRRYFGSPDRRDAERGCRVLLECG